MEKNVNQKKYNKKVDRPHVLQNPPMIFTCYLHGLHHLQGMQRIPSIFYLICMFKDQN